MTPTRQAAQRGSAQPGRRRLDTSVPADYDVPTRQPRLESPTTARYAFAATFLAWVAGVAVAGTAVVAVPHPAWIERWGAALLLVVFSIGLTHRGGGHMRIWTVAAGVLALSAVVTELNLLVAGAAAVSAILASVWAVVITRPARSAIGALKEFVLALAVALSGTLAVAAWNAPVAYQRFNLVVLAAALTLAIAFVWNLGAGLHGLGKQNIAIIAAVAAVLLVLLAYSSFVRTHGSETVVEGITNFVIWMRETVGGVPRPVEVFIGFPALIVGVSLRSKRRDGWWVLVFAVLGTGVLTTSLVSPGAYPSYIALSTVYSVVLGVVVGLVARYVAMRQRGSRASRSLEPTSRSEPGRLAPLK
ncbi:MAG: hypothetical protein EON53_12440 [Actinomycetales bacterium]|uniref:hypothetical protein n=1 Tax=Aeromicrobium sp. Leaf289 TaxID=1736324 RepID=UPI0006FBC127|nr:hypothetical protein [Aeromicrobium sp. Leaf289]KQP77980.1 hypothetical protein ASF37_05010 [Aeromicrobium sp. Leaf289]RYY44479.1 MAG: hypothetical protein EON53_12440 [Actinomycetales bacterium]